MTAITLYDFPKSSAAYRVRIGLGLKGLTWRTVPVDLASGAQRGADHRARNAQGLVPVLDIDGQRLTQSLAMLEYLDDTRPDPPFLPDAPRARARARQIAHIIAMDIHPVNNSGVLAHVEALTGGGEAARIEWMRHFMPKGLAGVEALLDPGRGGPFCVGPAPTLADICLIPQVYNARRWGIDLAPFPQIRAVDLACADLPAFAAAHPDRVAPQDGAG